MLTPLPGPPDPGTLDRFRADLYRFIRRKGFGREDADDLTQETLLRAYAHLSDFRGAHLSAWLYRIAANLCIDHARKRQLPTLPLGEDVVCGAEVDPAAELDRSEQRRAIGNVVRQLPECHQRILRLRYFEDCSVSDIANQIQCSQLAAKLRVFRAISALRKAWRLKE
jgi:RNA polymerase sigma-70 factor (ECF subfamily)